MKFFATLILLASAAHCMAADNDDLTRKNRALAAREAEVPDWMAKDQSETAAIKMKTFDPSTIGRVAYIFAAPITEVTPRATMVAILYRDTPCGLPLSRAKDLRAAESLIGRGLVPACWGRLASPANDGVLIVSKFGDSRNESLVNYAEAKIQADGSAAVLKPAMSHDEFMKNVDAYHKALR
jgi:hypothetical protein